jgi:hypothetical protein
VNCAAEGRETAAEHERRVNKIVQEREEKEKSEEEQAVKEMETVDLSTHEGCHTAARLLGHALSEFAKPSVIVLADRKYDLLEAISKFMDAWCCDGRLIFPVIFLTQQETVSLGGGLRSPGVICTCAET